MKTIADIYRAEILRAVLGPNASELKVADPARLAQIAARLAESEAAHGILRAKGYGGAVATLTDLVRDVPNDSPGILKKIFRPAPAANPYPSLGEVFDIWR